LSVVCVPVVVPSTVGTTLAAEAPAATLVTEPFVPLAAALNVAMMATLGCVVAPTVHWALSAAVEETT
jgi:hypothetical protein